jgi:hypothetical protein
MKNENLEALFSKLWKQYCLLNPNAEKIQKLVKEQCENPLNDHLAFRSFGVHPIQISNLSVFFEENDYYKTGEYEFPEKKLIAQSFSHPSNDYPRIFISQLVVEAFSTFLQEFVSKQIHSMDKKLLIGDRLFTSGQVWKNLDYKTFSRIKEESEYAAWLLVHGFCANHFTLSLNSMKLFENINQFNEFLESKGFVLNDSGGKIKGSPELYLEQSSTISAKRKHSFVDGDYDVSGCYYEFAKRYPMEGGKLFDGFVSKSADKIFESTDKSA